MDRCIEIITPSARYLVPVSSFRSCETPEELAFVAQSCLRFLCSLQILVYPARLQRWNPRLGSLPYRFVVAVDLSFGGAARQASFGVGRWRRHTNSTKSYKQVIFSLLREFKVGIQVEKVRDAKTERNHTMKRPAIISPSQRMPEWSCWRCSNVRRRPVECQHLEIKTPMRSRCWQLEPANHQQLAGWSQ